MNQPYSALSDSQLIARFRQGDAAAMEHLVLRHKDKIFTAISVIMRDRVTAEDLFQETFLKILRTIQGDRYAEQGKFLPWALRLAHNLCMDHFRARQGKPAPMALPEGQDLSALLDEHAPQAGHAMEQRQTAGQVRRLMERLPQDQREVVSLRIYGELSFKEISDITGVGINTALGRMRYGLQNMRRMIAQQGLVLR